MRSLAPILTQRDHRDVTERQASLSLGPLGGLNAALHFAAANGFDSVLSTPVDVAPLPSDLLGRLRCPGPAHFFNQHAVGCWPASLYKELADHLARGNRSIKSWIAHCGSKAVDDGKLGLYNLNEPSGLYEISKRLEMDSGPT